MPRLATILCILIVHCLGEVQGQAIGSSDCLPDLIQAYERFRTPQGEGYALDYQVETTLKKGISTQEKVSLKVYKEKSYIKTSTARIYQDAKAMVVVEDRQKSIFITQAMNKDLLEQQLGQMTAMQDSLLTGNSQVRCVQEPDKQIISVYGNHKTLQQLGLSSINYVLDKSCIHIRSITVRYHAQHDWLESVRVEFGDMDKHYSTYPYRGSSLDQIYTSSGQLRNTFSAYKVIDNLKPSTKQ